MSGDIFLFALETVLLIAACRVEGKETKIETIKMLKTLVVSFYFYLKIVRTATHFPFAALYFFSV